MKLPVRAYKEGWRHIALARRYPSGAAAISPEDLTMNTTIIPLLALLPILGCSPKGSRPHDMSEAQHETEAVRQEDAAAAHAERYDSTASVTECQSSSSHGYPTCWTSRVNPTEQHLRAAERARKAAEAHRAASLALATAEEKACQGLAPDDRDMSPFEHTEDIASVEPHARSRSGGKAGGTSTVDGAVVTFLAVRGMTAEWLQRVVDCHLARNAALGHDVPEMPDCPLVPKGAEATVESTGTGFAVTVWADDAEVGHEILARAQRLLPAAPATGK
jgi:hypothetical protein